mmetsp:Transcript_22058/g.42847  ORF Transcript_22058/g.42847 Transcript_22058/m.42847 type:complete len:201 (+) Transcript_22058:642-1244(+)
MAVLQPAHEVPQSTAQGALNLRNLVPTGNDVVQRVNHGGTRANGRFVAKLGGELSHLFIGRYRTAHRLLVRGDHPASLCECLGQHWGSRVASRAVDDTHIIVKPHEVQGALDVRLAASFFEIRDFLALKLPAESGLHHLIVQAILRANEAGGVDKTHDVELQAVARSVGLSARLQKVAHCPAHQPRAEKNDTHVLRHLIT